MIDSIEMDHIRRTQRLGAYAIVTRPGELLLTEIAPHSFPAGHWALPGGALEHGESPEAAMRRELYEETGLVAASWALRGIHDVHVVDRGRHDRWEDYHGVHIVYQVQTTSTESVQVQEVGGSTVRAAWVPWSQIPALPLIPVVTYVLEHSDDWGLTSQPES